ncbi:DUF6153 family protein [Streptomyces montanisoli]|uniref:DUF6153 family protein n=1 Tax=Streptomyces montanisoli TaxID=2798581 RepID=UPI00355687B5
MRGAAGGDAPRTAALRRPAALLALLWLLVAVVAHHSLASPSMTSAMHHGVVASVTAEPATHTPDDHSHYSHHETDPTASCAPSDAGHPAGGMGHCSSYDIRAGQHLAPPPLLGRGQHLRAVAQPAAPPASFVGERSPPDLFVLSVLRT